MNYGIPKVDRHLRTVMTKMLKSGRWELKPGKKHAKFVLIKSVEPALVGQILIAPGSTSDPIHGKKNFEADVKRFEKLAGFEKSSIEI